MDELKVTIDGATFTTAHVFQGGKLATLRVSTAIDAQDPTSSILTLSVDVPGEASRVAMTMPVRGVPDPKRAHLLAVHTLQLFAAAAGLRALYDAIGDACDSKTIDVGRAANARPS